MFFSEDTLHCVLPVFEEKCLLMRRLGDSGNYSISGGDGSELSETFIFLSILV